MRNHLVIGLGGTGGRVIRALRKRVYHEHRSHEIPGLALEYLYVDSSEELMKPGDPTWKTLGSSVQLAPGNQLRISGANIREIINNVRAYPTIQPWIGRPDLWQKVPSDVVTKGAAGQRRRMGRFLFAMNADEFQKKIQKLVGDMPRVTQSTPTMYHVVTGLAGGTGSGSVVDVIAQLSAFAQAAGQGSVTLYAVLPDRVPAPGWDAGNYHANGYAALLEINGLMIRRYQPWDLLRPNVRISVGDVFKGAYLISNENEIGYTVDMEDELPGVISDFLYEVISESADAKPPTQTLENFSSEPECVVGTAEGLRSRKFSSFGIKRVAVPEEELTEYLTLNFARQAVLQLYYNNWDDRFGFQEMAPQKNFAALVTEKDVQKRWMISEQHLGMELPVLEQDVDRAKKWQPSIDAEWSSIQAWIEPDCVEHPRETRLDELHKRFEEVFERGYRGRGVHSFYSESAAGRLKIARRIASAVERECFEKWGDGTHSARDVSELLGALRGHLESRQKTLEGRRSEIQEAIEAFGEEVKALRDQWAGLGLLTFPLKWKGIFHQFSNACRDQYHAMTDAIAVEFAANLIPQIIDGISEVRDSVNQVTARFEAGLDGFRKSLDARVRDDVVTDFRDVLVRYYDPKRVRETVERLVVNPDVQKQQAAVVRRALMDEQRLGGEMSFGRFLERVASVDLLDVIERTCMEQARIAHDNVVNDRERVLGVQLMKRLRDEYASNEEKLQEFARNIVLPAKTLVRFDPTEVQIKPSESGAPEVGGGAQAAVLVKRPCPDDLKDFVARLDQALTRVDLNVRKPTDNHGRPHELTILAFVGNFPARWIEIVKLLKDRYLRLLNGGGSELSRLELHTEDVALELPDLYLDSGSPKGTLSCLFLGMELGIVEETRDPMTGSPLVVARVGKGMEQRTLRLGANLESAEQDMKAADLLAIRGEVGERIAADFQHIDAKKEVQGRLEIRLNSIKSGLRGGDLNPDYARYRDAMIACAKILGV